MANVKIYKHFFTCLIFAKVRPLLTKVTDTQTDRQTDKETDKSIVIGEILQIRLKKLSQRYVKWAIRDNPPKTAKRWETQQGNSTVLRVPDTIVRCWLQNVNTKNIRSVISLYTVVNITLHFLLYFRQPINTIYGILYLGWLVNQWYTIYLSLF